MANLHNRLNEYLKKNEYFRRATYKAIPKEIYVAAKRLSEIMTLNSEEDYLLFLSSLVVLSAANKMFRLNKSVDCAKSYSFKNLVTIAIHSAIENNISNFKFDMQFDKNGMPITYVKFHNLQFSFHNVPFTSKMRWARTANKPQYEEQKWELMPLQNDAEKLFLYALSQDNLSRLDFGNTGLSPNDFVKSVRRKTRKQIALSQACLQNGVEKVSEESFVSKDTEKIKNNNSSLEL